MPDRIYNFSAGPATLPKEVLEQAAKDIVNFNDTGMGLIEMSHRSKDFMAVAEETESLLRSLMNIPTNYKVLFLQGGASTQFAMVPMNLLRQNETATYLNTGTWSNKAIKEAKLFGKVDVAFSSQENGFNSVPLSDDFSNSNNSKYLYCVSNNTIYGTQYFNFPKSKAPIVCDMSSDILSREIDVSSFGLIFAGAQKNMGPAGCTIVIVRDDLIEQAPDNLPSMFKYKTHADKGSMFNTPPCFALYTVGLVLKWLDKQGGVSAIQKRNEDKAGLIYETIDSSHFYTGHAAQECRSLMNISFNLPTSDLEEKFIQQASSHSLCNLKGHRSIGGIRTSIYNAFPKEGVEKLVTFMKEFENQNN